MQLLLGETSTSTEETPQWTTPTGEVSANGEVSFGGVLMGRNAFRLQSLEGWDDSTEYDVANAPRPSSHGSFLGSMYAQTRMVTATFQAVTETPEVLQQAVAAIRRVTVPTNAESELVVQLGAEKHLAYARCVRRSIPSDLNHSLGIGQITLQWEATDPRRYSTQEQQVSTGLPVTVSGIAFPFTFPVTFSAVTGGDGDVYVDNTGDVPTPPMLTISGGQVPNPVIACPDAGWRLELGLTVTAGDVLTVDVRTGRVLLNGVSRVGALSGLSSPVEDCLLPPGESAVAFRGLGDATLTVGYRSAYM